MFERRKTTRFPARIKFSFEKLNPSGPPDYKCNTLTKNISAGGLLFESEEEIPIGTKFNLNLNLPGQTPKLIDAMGEVARVERLFSTNNFEIGVTFIDLPASDEEEIKKRIERMDILKILRKAAENNASDLHLTGDSPPMVRIYGMIKPIDLEIQSLSSEEIEQMVYSILSDSQKQRFESVKDVDFVFILEPGLRYRVSVYQQRGKVEVVFRIIPSQIKSREELGLPPIAEDLCRLTDGIVIIAGTTGSGKTTTIAMMIDVINRTKAGVILSLEKPIEYIHNNIKGIVKQREVGVDVPSFAAGLTAGLRQDPDIIVVGEITDADTIETAINAAETGHLVITSIHAADTLQVIDRIISLFPLEQQLFIANRLSHCLRAIITQSLLPHKNGLERILATEICVATYAIKRTIHERNFIQLNSIIQSNAQQGMHLMQSSIDKIYEQGLVTGETYEMYGKRR
ncbi:MAG: PilT/PilU family type 4a pilus ATPase [Candidatus Omnitrophota bacterium]